MAENEALFVSKANIMLMTSSKQRNIWYVNPIQAGISKTRSGRGDRIPTSPFNSAPLQLN